MCCAGSVVVRCTGTPRLANETASAAATVVFPTPPFPITITRPCLDELSSSIRSAREETPGGGAIVPVSIASGRGVMNNDFSASRPDDIAADQRNFRPREGGQRFRNMGKCLLLSPLKGQSQRIIAVSRTKHAIDDQHLIFHCLAAQLPTRAGCFKQCDAVRACN